MATTIETAPNAVPAKDTFPINGTDYIEFYVGNAKQAAHFYRSAFGFQLVGYRGPETGVRDRASYLLQQDKIRFVVTTPTRRGKNGIGRFSSGANSPSASSVALICSYAALNAPSPEGSSDSTES